MVWSKAGILEQSPLTQHVAPKGLGSASDIGLMSLALRVVKKSAKKAWVKVVQNVYQEHLIELKWERKLSCDLPHTVNKLEQKSKEQEIRGKFIIEHPLLWSLRVSAQILG